MQISRVALRIAVVIHRWPAFLWRRNLVSDVVQGIIVGGVLAFVTFQIIAHAYVTKVERLDHHVRMRRARQRYLVQSRLRPNISWPDKRTARSDVLDNDSRWHGPKALLASTTTSCTFRQDNFRRTMRSGRSPWAMRGIALCRIRSTGTASAIVPAWCRMPTARSTFTSRTPLRPVMQSNWLPAPTGKFILWLRVYLPGPTILDGKYNVPSVVETQ